MAQRMSDPEEQSKPRKEAGSLCVYQGKENRLRKDGIGGMDRGGAREAVVFGPSLVLTTASA